MNLNSHSSQNHKEKGDYNHDESDKQTMYKVTFVRTALKCKCSDPLNLLLHDFPLCNQFSVQFGHFTYNFIIQGSSYILFAYFITWGFDLVSVLTETAADSLLVISVITKDHYVYFVLCCDSKNFESLQLICLWFTAVKPK